MMKLILSLGAVAAANLVLAFLSQGYVLLKVGPGVETDALYAGMTVPQLIISVLTGTFFYVMVPLLAGEDEQHLSQAAWGFFLLIGGIFGTFGLVLYLLAPFWVALLVPGFSRERLILTEELTRIQLIGMVFSALSCVLRAAYHARQRFFWPELSQFMGSFASLCVLISVLPRFGIRAAAGVNVLRDGLQTLLLLPGLGGYSKPDRSNAMMREAWCKIRPLALGTLYYKSGPMVDRFLASMAPSGGLSLFNFSQQIYGTATQLINKAAVGPMMPLLAAHAKTGKSELFKRIYRVRLLAMTGLAAATGLLIVGFGEPVLRLRGEIIEEDIKIFWWFMVALLGFFIGGVTGQVLSSAFYAKGDVKTPTKVGVIGFTLGIGLKVIGFLISGLVGVAFGTTVYYLGNAVALYLLLEKKEHVAFRSNGA